MYLLYLGKFYHPLHSFPSLEGGITLCSFSRFLLCYEGGPGLGRVIKTYIPCKALWDCYCDHGLYNKNGLDCLRVQWLVAWHICLAESTHLSCCTFPVQYIFLKLLFWNLAARVGFLYGRPPSLCSTLRVEATATLMRGRLGVFTVTRLSANSAADTGGMNTLHSVTAHYSIMFYLYLIASDLRGNITH